MPATRFSSIAAIAGLLAAAGVADADAPEPGVLSPPVAQAIARSLPLRVPVDGIVRSQIPDTFHDARAEGRPHEAIDIMAQRGTPVLAVGAGTIVKLFHSKPGGLTIYQFDPSRSVAYYYAHLDRYADGLAEGQTVERGQRLGDVGSTGNASPLAPHLHFVVFELYPERQWWMGRPIDPLPLFEDTQPAPPSR